MENKTLITTNRIDRHSLDDLLDGTQRVLSEVKQKLK